MAKDTQVNDDITNGETNGRHEHTDDVENTPDVAGAIETRTIISLEGEFKGEPGEPLVNKIESTTAEEGLVESINVRGSGLGGQVGGFEQVSALGSQRLDA